MFNNCFKGKKVLVTGNTGFKGSWLSLWLLELGADVYGLANGIPTNPSMYKILGLNDKINHYDADVRDYEQVKKIIQEVAPDFIFHLAAQSVVSKSYNDPLETISTNVIGTSVVLESLRHFENDCIAVIITSDKCYDNLEWEWGYREIDHLGGKDLYSGSKASAEIIFNSFFNSFFNNHNNVRIATARAGNVIGGGDWTKDGIISDCMKAWSQGKPADIRSPKATRPWQHVLEPLSGYLRLAQVLNETDSFNGESFNFGPRSQNNHTVIDLLNNLSKYWDLSHEPYRIVENVSFHEAGLLKLNCDKAIFHLDWRATMGYEDTTKFTSDWYNHYFSGTIDMLDFTLSQIIGYENIAKQQGNKWSL
jgi:CDP-glucose 4,6-dehydratase